MDLRRRTTRSNLKAHSPFTRRHRGQCDTASELVCYIAGPLRKIGCISTNVRQEALFTD